MIKNINFSDIISDKKNSEVKSSLFLLSFPFNHRYVSEGIRIGQEKGPFVFYKELMNQKYYLDCNKEV
jgi:hypothetical protein